MEFSITKATSPEQLDKIDEFVNTVFLPDMPLIHAFDIETSPAVRHPSPHQPSKDSQDIYLTAVDSRGEVVGIAVNKESVSFDTGSKPSPEWQKMVDFMEFIEEHAQMHTLPPKTIELLVLSVHPGWRNRGMAKRLAEESMKAAREAGFMTMTVCCTSEFTARLAKSLGWREHYRLAYKDYPRVSGREVYLKPTPPHDNVYFYITNL